MTLRRPWRRRAQARAPKQPELAICATTASNVSNVNQCIADEIGINTTYLESDTARQADTAKRYEVTFNSHRRPSVAGHGAIVDDGALDLRDQFDIDSMDFLNLVIGVHKALGVEIPEANYPKLVTLDGFVNYLVPRTRP